QNGREDAQDQQERPAVRLVVAARAAVVIALFLVVVGLGPGRRRRLGGGPRRPARGRARRRGDRRGRGPFDRPSPEGFLAVWALHLAAQEFVADPQLS